MLKYYAHTFSKYRDFMLSDIEKLENILKSGFLLSRRKLNMPSDDALFNGMDYISLCDLEKEHDSKSAYSIYVKNGISLLFSKNIDVFVPTHVYLDSGSITISDEMHHLGEMGRYSDMIDEVQVKDSLSLKYLRGLIISLKSIKEIHSTGYIQAYLGFMREMLKDYGYFVPIINLDDEQEIDDRKINIIK